MKIKGANAVSVVRAWHPFLLLKGSSRTEQDSAELLQWNTFFLSPHDHPSGVARKINGPQLRPSPLSSPSLQCASAPSRAECTDLRCYSAPALYLESVMHPAMCLLSTPLIRNVSATSLSARSPSPLHWEREHHPLGDSHQQDRRANSACFTPRFLLKLVISCSPVPFFIVKDLLCAVVILTVPIIPLHT